MCSAPVLSQQATKHLALPPSNIFNLFIQRIGNNEIPYDRIQHSKSRCDPVPFNHGSVPLSEVNLVIVLMVSLSSVKATCHKWNLLQCVNAHNQTVLEISYKWVKHTKYNNLMQVAASLLWISLSSHIQCKYVSLLLLFPPCLSICISVDLSKYTRYIYSILMEWILWDSCDLLTCLFFSSHVLLLWFVLFFLRLWLWFVLWCSSQCLYPALSLVDISGM